MPACRCGRQFRADQHPAQHRADIKRLGKPCDSNSPSPRQTQSPAVVSQDAWMWEGVQADEVLGTIQASELNPSPDTAQVSSSSGCDLICSYNWQIGGVKIISPGCVSE
ncbi:hypothetical protein V2G26_004171 [Clonostachys chloroleuca]